MTSTQAAVLTALESAYTPDLQPRDIAEATGLRLSQVEGCIPSLERHGWIARVHRPASVPAHFYQLTEAGRALVRRGQ